MADAEDVSKYDSNRHKRQARLRNLRIYKELIGLSHIPEGRQYWTLCSDQTGLSSEIRQLIKSRFLTEGQFCGVDVDQGLIDGNRGSFPKASWFCGRFVEEVLPMLGRKFRPALVFYDAIEMADSPHLWRQVHDLLYYCDAGTVVLVNAVMRNPHSGKVLSREHVDGIAVNFGRRHRISVGEDQFFSYRGNKVGMRTFAFRVDEKLSPSVPVGSSCRPKRFPGKDKYQWQRDATRCLRRSRNLLLVAPCSAGKTHLMSRWASREFRGKKVLIVSPQTHIADNFCKNLGEAAQNYGSLRGSKTKALISFLQGAPKGPQRIAVTTHHAVGLAWNKVRRRKVCNLVLVIDESHHAAVCRNDSNRIAKVMHDVLSCRGCRVIRATATPYRGDGAPIVDAEDAPLFENFHLSWDEWLPETGIKEVRTRYLDYGGLKDLFLLIAGEIEREPGKKHVVVVPSSGQKWRTRWENGIQLIAFLKQRMPEKRIVGLVDPGKQREGKDLLVSTSGREVDVVVLCKMGREGLDLVPHCRLHHADPEKSITLAIQTAGRVFRSDVGKDDVEVTYYVPRMSEDFDSKELSEHTNMVLAGMVVTDYLDPIRPPLLRKGQSRRRKPARDIVGDELWGKVIREMIEGIEAKGEEKNEAVERVIETVLDGNPEFVSKLGREEAKGVLCAFLLRFMYDGIGFSRSSDDVARLVEDPEFDIVKECDAVGSSRWSFYRSSATSAYLSKVRGLLETGEEAIIGKVRDAIARMKERASKGINASHRFPGFPRWSYLGQERCDFTLIAALKVARNIAIDNKKYRRSRIWYPVIDIIAEESGYPGLFISIDKLMLQAKEVLQTYGKNGDFPSRYDKDPLKRKHSEFIRRIKFALYHPSDHYTSRPDIVAMFKKAGHGHIFVVRKYKKLNPSQKMEIRKAYSQRCSFSWGVNKFAQKFGVDRVTIRRVIKEVK